MFSPPYPNPTPDILNIEINNEFIENIKAHAQTIDYKSFSEPTFDIRLYDSMGNTLRQQQTQGGTVQFNVSILQNGFYYLHILNADTGEILDRQQVEIKR